ncbi:alpha/beta fold hydrolase [Pelagicoccus sp. SDUM812002]|uniref:alpha/beta fold hydrolase n=1 Tax=Pelagicoccus sp. SDUM812002 TaxID=3041266 RepID=UPI00280EF9C0|nr:alpha/beta fold hydrolase [Pelagicoccus sp. SDUM812002]MDQ8185369.1 alpha/beta fold hydrolase [Pelagicoccus sp. SDUM812002]
MDLFYREFGEAGKPVVVILHGLLGSSRNWQAAGQALAERHHVYCLDLRNHGESPWEEPHSYEVMMEDVMTWMDETLDSRPILVGHSMGGKLAMKLACEYPKAIRKLVVVDIQPHRYPNNHDNDFAGMAAVNMDSLKSRTDAEAMLEPFIPSWKLRKFLLTNLEKDRITGEYRWMVNLDAIVGGQRDIEENPLSPEDRYEGDTLFIMGGKSRYFVKEEVPRLREYFPSSALEVIPESGHNPHFECRERFVEILAAFVD